MEHTLINNEVKRYYAFEVEGKTARIEYIIAPHKFFLTHTEVPEPLAGKA